MIYSQYFLILSKSRIGTNDFKNEGIAFYPGEIIKTGQEYAWNIITSGIIINVSEIDIQFDTQNHSW